MPIHQLDASDRAIWLAYRHHDMTASVVGALLGVHEYTTAYEQWAIKSGRIAPNADETPAMKRGRLLEPVAIQLLQEARPELTLIRPEAYFTDTDIRLGATPDLFADCPTRGPGVVQIKTTAEQVFRTKWFDRDTGDIVVPLWIAVQALVEAHLTGRRWAEVAVMVVGQGLDLHTEPVPLNQKLIARIRAETARFWLLVESGAEPPPDYARDGAVIDRIYAEDDGGEIDLSQDERVRELVSKRAALKSTISQSKEDLERCDAELRHRMGNAALAHLGGGETMTLRTHRRHAYEVRESTYRVLRTPKDNGR